MIYLFSGDDAKKKNAAYEKFLKSLGEDVTIFSIEKNNFDSMQIESLYSGSGLFYGRSAAILSNIFENEKAKDFLLEKLGFLNNSSNYFVFVEGKLGKPIIEAFKKAGVKESQMEFFELPKEKLEKFNNFLLANALGDKDKLTLWIYFRLAVGKGVSLEELSGVLFWKAKDMILKRNFGKFKEEELKNFAGKLSCLLPEARKDGRDAEAAFEQYLLEAI